MTEYERLQEEITAKGKALAAIFDEMGPERDASRVKSISNGDSRAVVAEIKRRNDELADLNAKAEGMRVVNEIGDRLAAIRPPAPVPNEARTETKGSRYEGKTLADVFMDSPAFKSYRERPQVDVDLGDPRDGGIELKTLLDRSAWSIEPDRQARILPGALRRPVVADLIPAGGTNSNQVKYMEETTTTNAVAAVAEGATKPESALAFTARTAAVEKLASVLPVTDELFEDAPALRAYIEARMRLFLQIAEENALLSGTGTTPQIRGILNFAGIQTQAKGADPTPTAVYKAITLIRANAFLEPSAAIFHPLDWQDVATLTTADGIYIWGAPYNEGPARIWGLPVVVTPAITQNTALVGAFDAASQLFRRNQVSFAVFDQHSTFAAENKLLLRIEERLALAVYRPAGFCTVTGV